MINKTTCSLLFIDFFRLPSKITEKKSLINIPIEAFVLDNPEKNCNFEIKFELFLEKR